MQKNKKAKAILRSLRERLGTITLRAKEIKEFDEDVFALDKDFAGTKLDGVMSWLKSKVLGVAAWFITVISLAFGLFFYELVAHHVYKFDYEDLNTRPVFIVSSLLVSLFIGMYAGKNVGRFKRFLYIILSLWLVSGAIMLFIAYVNVSQR